MTTRTLWLRALRRNNAHPGMQLRFALVPTGGLALVLIGSPLIFACTASISSEQVHVEVAESAPDLADDACADDRARALPDDAVDTAPAAMRSSPTRPGVTPAAFKARYRDVGHQIESMSRTRPGSPQIRHLRADYLNVPYVDSMTEPDTRLVFYRKLAQIKARADAVARAPAAAVARAPAPAPIRVPAAAPARVPAAPSVAGSMGKTRSRVTVAAFKARYRRVGRMIERLMKTEPDSPQTRRIQTRYLDISYLDAMNRPDVRRAAYARLVRLERLVRKRLR